MQKYRSHRKHLLAREAEAASWSQRRQLRPWAAAPTMGFPPVNLVRPLHVWGHPSVDQSIMPMPIWPKHLNPADPPSFWINSHHHVTNSFIHHLNTPLLILINCFIHIYIYRFPRLAFRHICRHR